MFRVMRNAITSFSNEKVKYVSGLKEKKNRDKNKHFFLEGFRELKKGFESKKITFHSLFVSQECFLGVNEDSLINEIEKSGTPIFELPRKIFEKISYRDRPDGLIAIGNIPDFGFLGTKKIPGDFFAIIEGVEKPGNLGTILRTAEGAGVDAIFVVDSKLDIFNHADNPVHLIPKVIDEVHNGRNTDQGCPAIVEKKSSKWQMQHSGGKKNGRS
jgi:TrmH family RNA methyltransferase